MKSAQSPRHDHLASNSPPWCALAGLLYFLASTGHGLFAQLIAPFGIVTAIPDFEVNGAGTNVDSIAFWETPDPNDTLMFVTAKGNDLVEVWKFPFVNNELPPIQFPTNVNGVAVDQKKDLLYVSDSVVSVFSLPDLAPIGEFGAGVIGVGENNIDVLQVSGGRSIVYVTDDQNVHSFNGSNWRYFGAFAPPVSSIETVLADDFHQIIHVPEEQGPAGNPGVYTYHVDGTPFERNGSNVYGDVGIFSADEEGILLYSFPAHGTTDDGSGFIVVSDQQTATLTEFEFFDRQTAAHLGTVLLTGVTNTDGIASTQRPLAQYPMGIFAAIDNDTATAVIGWDAIFAALGWDLAPEAMSITPGSTGPTAMDHVDFAIVFSEAVTNFNDAADVLITHMGTAHGGVTITGSGTNYTVSVTGITGVGSLTMAVNPASDLEDSTSQSLAAGVTSDIVLVGTPFQFWTVQRGLTPGVNDAPGDDPDNDRCSNFKEFALDGDPLDGGEESKLKFELADYGGPRHLSITFPARQNANFTGSPARSATTDGVRYSISATTDLTNFDQPVEEVIPALASGLPALDPAWQYHTFRLSSPVAPLSPGFVRFSIGPEP